MSLPPITIPLLDPVTFPLDDANDLMLVRQGLNDRKATVAQVASPKVNAYPTLPTEIQSNDYFLVNRAGSNYKTTLQYFGLSKGVAMFFWNAVAPLGWSVVPNSGDKVLATAGGAVYINPGFLGDWQQLDHALTIQQMPNHNHTVGRSKGSGESFGNFRAGSSGDGAIVTGAAGGSLGHNHGNAWRPAAAVGLLCIKDV